MVSGGKRPDGVPGGERPRYEAPVVLPLGGIARGIGGTCTLGGSPNSGQAICSNGVGANGRCRAGSSLPG